MRHFLLCALLACGIIIEFANEAHAQCSHITNGDYDDWLTDQAFIDGVADNPMRVDSGISGSYVRNTMVKTFLCELEDDWDPEDDWYVTMSDWDRDISGTSCLPGYGTDPFSAWQGTYWYAQWLAWHIYVDKNNLVAWDIDAMSTPDREAFYKHVMIWDDVGWWPEWRWDRWSQDLCLNEFGNPLEIYDWLKQSSGVFSSGTQAAAAADVVERLMGDTPLNEGFGHFIPGVHTYNYDDCDYDRVDFNCIVNGALGTDKMSSLVASFFLRVVYLTLNIPAYDDGGGPAHTTHHGLYLKSAGLYLTDGNNFYGRYRGGAACSSSACTGVENGKGELAFITETETASIAAQTSPCRKRRMLHRIMARNWLDTMDESYYGNDVKRMYCRIPGSIDEGELLRTELNLPTFNGHAVGSPDVQCQTTCPSCDYYSPPIFTDTEWASYMDDIESEITGASQTCADYRYPN